MHAILDSDLIFQKLNLLVPLREHGFVHFNYLLLCKAQHILLGHDGRLHFLDRFFIRLVPVAFDELGLRLYNLELVVTRVLLVELLLLVRLRVLPLVLQLRRLMVIALFVKLVKKTL